MKGKILKVFNNDLYGHADDRKAIVFATFIHKKYMNKYAVFVFQNEYHQNKLYYGSIHIKENSLVIFKVKTELSTIFNEFLREYTNQQLVDFELLDISNLTKLELVGYNEMAYDKISLLDDLSIPKAPVKANENNQNSSTFKIILPIVLLIIGAISAYVFLNPSLLEHKILKCNRNSYHTEMRLNYQEKLEIIFNGRNQLKKFQVEETYKFRTTLTYQNFKDESRHYLYFEGDDKTYKYNDQDLELIVTYERTSDVNDLSKMAHQLEQEGYNCIEERYEK